MLISEAFNLYTFEEVRLRGGSGKTVINYTSALNSLTSNVGDIPIELIGFDTITRWKMALVDRSVQLSTVKAYISCLRQVLRYFGRRGVRVFDYRDIELPQVIRKEAQYLEIPELKAILDAAQNIRDRAIIATIFSCGGRVGEVLSLNRDSIKDKKAQVVGKGSRLNTLRFDDNTLALIEEYLGTRKDSLTPLFISGQYRRITVQRVEQILHVLAAEAGISKNVTPHTLRHSFATDLLMNGADLVEVKEQLNHKSIMTTQIYTHISKSRKEESYRKHHTVI